VSHASLARRLVQSAQQYAASPEATTPEIIAKVKIAFLDMLSCVFEARDLSYSGQAIKLAKKAGGGKSAVIAAGFRAPAADAAFANATMAHGLVREDMHTGSVSHLGIVIFPALLALAEENAATGLDFVRAVVCGYEAGAVLGQALMDKENVRLYRPTGVTGTIGAALAAALLLGLGEDAAVSAVGLAANLTVGLNEWPFTGADDMFFHAGFAARNAVTSAELAALGARGSESALDGRAGLFTAMQRADRADGVTMFAGKRPEILEVFHKPVPACNYAQTPCQAALELTKEHGVQAADIAAVRVRASAEALNYPGCNNTGPFASILQGKMSIQFGVAATLARGSLQASNFTLLEDPEVLQLTSLVTLEEDAGFTAAYPGLQGAEISITTKDGRNLVSRMDDLVPATEALIRARFRSACSTELSGAAAASIEKLVEGMESLSSAGDLGRDLIKLT
jgi:2-methylcitrate dehydratase PrpD